VILAKWLGRVHVYTSEVLEGGGIHAAIDLADVLALGEQISKGSLLVHFSLHLHAIAVLLLLLLLQTGDDVLHLGLLAADVVQ
jgi:hypothetical protein